MITNSIQQFFTECHWVLYPYIHWVSIILKLLSNTPYMQVVATFFATLFSKEKGQRLPHRCPLCDVSQQRCAVRRARTALRIIPKLDYGCRLKKCLDWNYTLYSRTRKSFSKTTLLKLFQQSQLRWNCRLFSVIDGIRQDTTSSTIGTISTHLSEGGDNGTIRDN
jgi:hypothetical protein